MPDLGHRPDKMAAVQTLGVEAHALAVIPEQLDDPTPATAEREYRAIERVLLQHLLCQHRQPVHAFPHVGPAAGQPDAHPGGRAERADRYWLHRSASQPDHPRNAASTRRSACSSTCASTLM